VLEELIITTILLSNQIALSVFMTPLAEETESPRVMTLILYYAAIASLD